MMQIPSTTRVYLSCRPTDMRKGFDGLAAQVSTILHADPYSGHLFVFRGKRGDLIKILYWDGTGLCLFAKRLEQHRFVWPPIIGDSLHLTRAQLDMLLEGMDWRRTVPAPMPNAPAYV
ncbi:MAG: IS66 family insertion sequence element accessory protein TnpB [Alphaproteobacteria bacterium]|nr:IS66 family insertion sequence element accessory protein TnpB [Alphaproteobacteria bacterium]